MPSCTCSLPVTPSSDVVRMIGAYSREHLRPHDEVDEPGLVLERHERHARRGARLLPADHDADVLDALAVAAARHRARIGPAAARAARRAAARADDRASSDRSRGSPRRSRRAWPACANRASPLTSPPSSSASSCRAHPAQHLPQRIAPLATRARRARRPRRARVCMRARSAACAARSPRPTRTRARARAAVIRAPSASWMPLTQRSPMRTAKREVVGRLLERAIPLAARDVDRPDRRARVAAHRRRSSRRVEPHRLRVEQRARELRQVVLAHPRRRVRDQREARGVAVVHDEVVGEKVVIALDREVVGLLLAGRLDRDDAIPVQVRGCETSELLRAQMPREPRDHPTTKPALVLYSCSGSRACRGQWPGRLRSTSSFFDLALRGSTCELAKESRPSTYVRHSGQQEASRDRRFSLPRNFLPPRHRTNARFSTPVTVTTKLRTLRSRYGRSRS